MVLTAMGSGVPGKGVGCPSDLGVRRFGRVGLLNSLVSYGILQRLCAVPSKKVERAVRRALNDGRTAFERIELALMELDAAGIQAPPPIKPLPSAALGEVRLVAWIAVKGKPIRSD